MHEKAFRESELNALLIHHVLLFFYTFDNLTTWNHLVIIQTNDFYQTCFPQTSPAAILD